MHYVFPCFNKPDLRAKFVVTIYHQQQYTALSNMPAKEITKAGNIFSIMDDESIPKIIRNEFKENDETELKTNFYISEEMAVSSFAFSTTSNIKCNSSGHRTNVYAVVCKMSIFIKLINYILKFSIYFSKIFHQIYVNGYKNLAIVH